MKFLRLHATENLLVDTFEEYDRALERSPSNEPAMLCRLDTISSFTYCKLIDKCLRFEDWRLFTLSSSYRHRGAEKPTYVFKT